MPKLSESALKAKIAELQKELDDRAKKRRPIIDKIISMMNEAGLTVADLQAAAPKAPARGRKKGTPKAAATGKVEAKYRDAATGATWTGRRRGGGPQSQRVPDCCRGADRLSASTVEVAIQHGHFQPAV